MRTSWGRAKRDGVKNKEFNNYNKVDDSVRAVMPVRKAM